MSEQQPWTIESIHEALGVPALASRFLGEINKAPAHQLLTVFAKWERIAKNINNAFDDADRILEAEARGEEPEGEWIDGTDRLAALAARNPTHGAA